MSILAILLGIVFIAYEKKGVKTEIIELNEEEFTNETGNHDQVLDIKNEEIINQNFRIQAQENQLLKKEKHQVYLTLSILSAILGSVLLLFIYWQRQNIKE